MSFPYTFPIDWAGGPVVPDYVIGRLSANTTPFDSPDWEDVSADIMSISIRRGRQYEMSRFEAGTAVIRLKNTSGNYWPNNIAGAFYPDIKPYKRFQIRKTYGDPAVSYTLFTGFVEQWKPGWVLHPITGAYMDVSLVDLFRSLSRLETDADGYPQELTGTRVSRVLTALDWTGSDIDAGEVQCAAINAIPPAVEYMVNALEHLQSVAELENGQLYVAADGDVQFEDRYHRMTDHITPVATFGDGVGDMPIYSYDLSYDDEHIWNEVKVSPDDGETWQTVSNAVSISDYGKRTLLIQAPAISDADALALAQHLLNRYAQPYLVAKSITIKTGADPTNLCPKAWGYDISDCIAVRLTEADIFQNMWIDSIEHDWVATQPENWTTRWGLSIASGYQYWLLENAVYGKLGTTTKLGY